MTDLQHAVGYYCWAGPGTIRMLHTKYFNPRIDEASVMGSYEYDYLMQIKERFGVTDCWATYSWGYSDKREEEDHEFLLSRQDNFRRAGIRLHAYLQGTNLVYGDFPDQKLWAIDNYGHDVLYFKGRKVTCVNNPYFQEIFTKRLTAMTELGSDGIFIDNVQMGQMSLEIEGYPFAFVGCRCQYCQDLFNKQHGLSIPKHLKPYRQETQKYLQFRQDSLHRFIEKASTIVRTKNIMFGTNSYDPKFSSTVVYGFDPLVLANYQDYLLFEHHSFPSAGESQTQSIQTIAAKVNVPVFSLSYRYGIGQEQEFTQTEINSLYQEATQTTVNVLLKGSEYTTNGEWHNLRPERYEPINVTNHIQETHTTIPPSLLKHHTNNPFIHLAGTPIIDWGYPQFMNAIMNSRWFRPLLGLLYRYVIR